MTLRAIGSKRCEIGPKLLLITIIASDIHPDLESHRPWMTLKVTTTSTVG